MKGYPLWQSVIHVLFPNILALSLWTHDRPALSASAPPQELGGAAGLLSASTVEQKRHMTSNVRPSRPLLPL